MGCLFIEYRCKKLTSLRRIFHLFARICLGMEVMVLSVAVFLFVLVIVGYPKSWIILIAGVAAIFIADAVYVAGNKAQASDDKLSYLYSCRCYNAFI